MTAPLYLDLSQIKNEDRIRTNPADYADLSDLDTIADLGLIEPIVVAESGDGFRLVAGGRRTKWLQDHGFTTLYHGFTCDPEHPGFLLTSELEPAKLVEVELMENLGRTQMTWQDRTLAIAKIHNLRVMAAAQSGDDWGHRETARLLGKGYSLYNVNYALTIAKFLRAGDEEITKAEGFSKAIDLLMERKEREVLAHAQKLAAVNALPAAVDLPQVEVPEGEKVEPTLYVKLDIHHMDSLGFLAAHPESFDHIITDPPYAIDMGAFTMAGVDRVEKEHEVDPNHQLLASFITKAYDALRDKGFLIFWADEEHRYWLAEIARQVGFSVTDWSLIWCKTHPTMNNQAQANFTKATEIAIVCRKGRATLVSPQAKNFWVGTFEPGERDQYKHPFVKPKALWKWLFQAVALPGQTILDPFAGEGSCLLAGISAGYQMVGCEISDLHFPLLQHNLETYYRRAHGSNLKFV
jgi:DNA modification methylase/ParB-like chromosome segregation protein Spo0J